MYAASVVKAMLGQATTGVIPVELLTTHRIMERHAVSNGSGLPTERWDDTRTAKPPPLDDHSAYIIDKLLLSCPKTTQRLLRDWYNKPLPTKTLAAQHGMSPRSFEKAHIVTLHFMKWKIEGSKHATLLRLLQVRPA
jgi:hypothetical protein